MELLKLFKRSDAPPVLPAGYGLRRSYADGRSVPDIGLSQVFTRPPRALPTPPLELAAFRPVRAAQLESGRQQALLKVFQNIPRPKPLLSQLLAPDFLALASGSSLVDWVSTHSSLSEGLVRTAKARAYGAPTSIGSVVDAVEALGFSAAHALCLRELLTEVFPAQGHEQQALLETIWQSSVLATDICLRLSDRLGYAEAHSLVACMSLIFVGRLATVSSMPRKMLAQVPQRGLLSRARAEQGVFGLSSAELGRLLMLDWGLPAQTVDEAAEIDAVLFAPYAAWEPTRAARLALGYLSARLGERLACDATSSLDDFDLLRDEDPEMHHVRDYLQHPVFNRVTVQLANPEFRACIDKLRLELLAPN